MKYITAILFMIKCFLLYKNIFFLIFCYKKKITLIKYLLYIIKNKGEFNMKEQNVNNTNTINDKNKIDEDRFSSTALLNAFIIDSLNKKNNKEEIDK